MSLQELIAYRHTVIPSNQAVASTESAGGDHKKVASTVEDDVYTERYFLGSVTATQSKADENATPNLISLSQLQSELAVTTIAKTSSAPLALTACHALATQLHRSGYAYLSIDNCYDSQQIAAAAATATATKPIPVIELIANAFAATEHFFNDSSLEQKRSYSMSNDSQFGYAYSEAEPAKREEEGGSIPTTQKEIFVASAAPAIMADSLWPKPTITDTKSRPPALDLSFRGALTAYTECTHRTSRLILSALETAISAPAGSAVTVKVATGWSSFVPESLTGLDASTDQSILKCILYRNSGPGGGADRGSTLSLSAPPPADTSQSMAVEGLSEHFDLGLITLVPIAHQPGLAVWDRSLARWVYPEETGTPHRTVLVLTGMQLQRASADYFPATRHAVVLNRSRQKDKSAACTVVVPVAVKPADRLSLCYLQRAKSDAVIDCNKLSPTALQTLGLLSTAVPTVASGTTSAQVARPWSVPITVEDLNSQYLIRLGRCFDLHSADAPLFVS